jgi:hypothetical protein
MEVMASPKEYLEDNLTIKTQKPLLRRLSSNSSYQHNATVVL